VNPWQVFISKISIKTHATQQKHSASNVPRILRALARMVSTSGATEWSCSTLKHTLASVDRMSMSVKYHLQ